MQYWKHIGNIYNIVVNISLPFYNLLKAHCMGFTCFNVKFRKFVIWDKQGFYSVGLATF